MTKRVLWTLMAVVMVALTSVTVAADDAPLDPLLELLVEQGVITNEQAVAVQAEKERREVAAAAQAQSVTPVAASEPEEETKTKSEWFDRVDFKGDVRLRYEGFNKDNSFDDDRRDRFRIRLRAGALVDVTDNMQVGIELRNGDPNDPVSNNTSFDGAFQFKEFNLAQGFLDFSLGKRFAMIVGKYAAAKRWTVSDFQWDDDITVEGMMQNFKLAEGGGRFSALKLTTYQFLLEESRTEDDAYVFGAQLRSDVRLNDRNTLAVGAGFDYWDNPQAVADLTLSGKLAGNAVTNLLDEDGLLVSDFEIMNLFTEWKFVASERWPLKVNLFYYQNLGANGEGADQDTGYFGRVQVGDYKTMGQVALRYSYYYSEPDALFYVFTQSDTSRGSDVKAHRFDLRIGFVAKSYFNLTWYNTRPAYQQDESLNRWQMDYIVRF